MPLAVPQFHASRQCVESAESTRPLAGMRNCCSASDELHGAITAFGYTAGAARAAAPPP